MGNDIFAKHLICNDILKQSFYFLNGSKAFLTAQTIYYVPKAREDFH